MLQSTRMTEDGWERVRAVRLRALLDAPDAFGRLHSEEVDREPAMWRGRLADDRSDTFLASLNGEDVGIVSVAEHGAKKDAAGLFSMWVAPEVRGSEAASMLIERAVDWARSRGYGQIFLDVADENARAIAFYARHGFEPTGATGTLPEPRTHVTEHERVLELRDDDHGAAITPP